MTDTTPEPARMSELQRITGIFWEPKPVFENLVAHPRWWTPLILMTVLAVIYVTAFSRIVGWETFMRQQLQSNVRLQQLPPEQVERVIEQQTKIASYFGIGGACVGVALSTLAIAGILLGIFNLFGGARLKFKQAFSVTCYSFLPTGLSTILALVVMYFKDPAEFDLQHPLPLSVGALLDPAAIPKWLHSIATSINAFTIWVMLLLAVGFSVAAKHIRFGKALTLIVIPWAIYVAVKSGWAALFG